MSLVLTRTLLLLIREKTERSLQTGRGRCGEREALPVGQTDSFDSVVAVVHLVAGFKHDTEPAAAETLHRLKVSQVPGERHRRSLGTEESDCSREEM